MKSELTTPTPEAKEAVRQLLPEVPEYIEYELRKLTDDTGYGQRLLTAEEKATVVRMYAECGSLVKCSEAIHCSPATLYRHMEIDPQFRSAFSLAKLSLGDRVQTKSVERALTDNGVVDRMCQLKRFFPTVYRESQQVMNVGIAVNLGITAPGLPPA